MGAQAHTRRCMCRADAREATGQGDVEHARIYICWVGADRNAQTVYCRGVRETVTAFCLASHSYELWVECKVTICIHSCGKNQCLDSCWDVSLAAHKSKVCLNSSVTVTHTRLYVTVWALFGWFFFQNWRLCVYNERRLKGMLVWGELLMNIWKALTAIF